MYIYINKKKSLSLFNRARPFLKKSLSTVSCYLFSKYSEILKVSCNGS